jgi:hypothetical protein
VGSLDCCCRECRLIVTWIWRGGRWLSQTIVLTLQRYIPAPKLRRVAAKSSWGWVKRGGKAFGDGLCQRRPVAKQPPLPYGYPVGQVEGLKDRSSHHRCAYSQTSRWLEKKRGTLEGVGSRLWSGFNDPLHP